MRCLPRALQFFGLADVFDSVIDVPVTPFACTCVQLSIIAPTLPFFLDSVKKIYIY